MGPRPRGAARCRVSPAGDDLQRAIAEAQAIEEPGEWEAVDRAFALAVPVAHEAPSMPAAVAVATVGALVATGSVDAARQLLGTVERWVSAAGEVRAMPGELAVRWPIARDLVRLAEVLRARQATWLARHVIRGRFEQAAEVLHGGTNDNLPRLRAAMAAIEGSTSLLAQRIRPTLAMGIEAFGPTPQVPGPRRLLKLVLMSVAVFVGLIVLLITVMLVGTALSH
jgi:hypothetical protein